MVRSECTVLIVLHLTWQRRRRQRRWRWWGGVLLWSRLECETESLCATVMSLCVKESVCCSGSGRPRSSLLWKPQRPSGRSDERQRDSKRLLVKSHDMISATETFDFYHPSFFSYFHQDSCYRRIVLMIILLLC